VLLIFCPPVLDIKTVAQWQAGYSLVADLNEFDDNSKSGDSNQYYQISYSLDGNRAMFEATGDLIYMDRCLYYINNMINDAKLSSTIANSQYKDTYYGWPSSADDGTEQILRELFGFRFVWKILDAIKDYNLGSSYQTQYNNIYTWVERNIWQKWYARGTSNMYRNVIHIASHIAWTANFFRRRSSNPTIVAQATTMQNNIDNLGIAAFNGSCMRNQLHAHPADARAYYWNMYWDGIPSSGKPSEPYGSDINHGQAVISYVIDMFERGYGNWSIDDISKLLWTFNIIWKSGSSICAWLVGPSNSSVFAGNINEWAKLGRFDVNAQKNVELISMARNASYWGNGALNAKKLLGV